MTADSSQAGARSHQLPPIRGEEDRDRQAAWRAW